MNIREYLKQEIIEKVEKLADLNQIPPTGLKTPQSESSLKYSIDNRENEHNNRGLVQITIDYLPKAIAQLKSGHVSLTIDELQILLSNLRLSFAGEL